MKIKDIYTDLNKQINLKKKKITSLILDNIESHTNIDSIRKNKWKIIQLDTKRKLWINNLDKINIDWVKRKQKNKQKINLKKIIWNSKYLVLLNFISKINIFNIIKLPKNKILKVSSYFIFLFSLILLDKVIIENLVISWINNLYRVEVQTDLIKIETELSKAKTKFNIANILFLPFKLFPETNIQNANNWIKLLQKSTQLWLNVLKYTNTTKKFIQNKKIDEIYFANLVENSKPFLLDTESEINSLIKISENITLKYNSNINSNFQKLNNFKDLLIYTHTKIKYINNNYEILLNILWRDRAKKYFIVFQNNDEIRPTWWFMWSAWILEIFEWKIKSFNKKDIYAYEWDSKINYTEKVKWPSWVNLLSERLWLRDSNAFINFQTSAKSINYFMKKWWYNIDWVVFINQKLIIDILEDLWEINFWKYDSNITSKNFSEIISLLVEAKVSKKSTLDTPKQVLFDFGKIVLNKIKSEKNYKVILKNILSNLKNREIVFYNFNKDEAIFLDRMDLNWNYRFDNKQDYNFPFFISVWWNKSDRYIKREYIKNVTLSKNSDNTCDLNSNFKIKLSNIFKKEDEKRIINNMRKFRINPTNDLVNIAWKWLNQNYTKLIIPWNAIINNESNSYKYINHWSFKTIEKLIQTKPLETSFFNVNYSIENINCNEYSSKIYKQSWIYNYNIHLTIDNKINDEKENIKADWLTQDFNYNY